MPKTDSMLPESCKLKRICPHMVIIQGLNFIQIVLCQFRETKPKTFFKGKVHCHTRQLALFVYRNICIMHWLIFHGIQNTVLFIYQEIPGRNVFPYFAKCFDVLDVFLINLQTFSKVLILLSLTQMVRVSGPWCLPCSIAFHSEKT